MLSGKAEAERLMDQVGVHPEGIKIMAGKAQHRLVKLENLDVRAANIIKQEMLSRGGEAAVSWTVYSLSKDTSSDAVIMGTDRQIREVCDKLQLQPFGLAEIGTAIRQAVDAFETGPSKIRIGDIEFDFGRRTYLMGILNVTPDSFSDGGRYLKTEEAVARGLEMAEEGADLIDVGGESTRPGSGPVSLDEELKRVVPVVEKLAARTDRPISIDTTKSEVAKQALAAGAAVVNDVSAFRVDKEMSGVVAAARAPVVLMHMKGTPKDMQADPQYDDVMDEIAAFLAERIKFAEAGGVPRQRILLDPGLGFGKAVDHNLEIIRRLGELKSLGCPIVLGPSRKAFIGDASGAEVEDRVHGTAAAVAAAVGKGASVVRVHDVREMAQAAAVAAAIHKTDT